MCLLLLLTISGTQLIDISFIVGLFNATRKTINISQQTSRYTAFTLDDIALWHRKILTEKKSVKCAYSGQFRTNERSIFQLTAGTSMLLNWFRFRTFFNMIKSSGKYCNITSSFMSTNVVIEFALILFFFCKSFASFYQTQHMRNKISHLLFIYYDSKVLVCKVNTNFPINPFSQNKSEDAKNAKLRLFCYGLWCVRTFQCFRHHFHYCVLINV